MAKTATKPVLTATGLTSLPTLNGANFSVFQKGTDLFETLRIGGDVNVKGSDDVVKPAKVLALQVGPLIDLVLNFGPQSGLMMGRPYTPMGLIQTMTDASTEDVLDVTKLYTAVTVSMVPETAASPSA